jgi:hypothetical protein
MKSIKTCLFDTNVWFRFNKMVFCIDADGNMVCLPPQWKHGMKVLDKNGNKWKSE